MKDFQSNPMAQEAAGLLSFMGTPGGRDSRFRATAKAVDDYDLDSFAKDGGTACKVTFVDRNNPGWQQTVQININYASVSAAAHLVGQGAMGKILNSVIAGYEWGTPAKIDINDPHVHDGNNVLFTAYMQLTQGYDMSKVVSAKPSQSFDAQLANLLQGRKDEITDSLKRTDPYNQVLDNANLDAVKKVFKSPTTSGSGQESTYRTPIAGGSSWPSAAQQPPTGRNSYAPPAGKNPPGPYETPSTSSPAKPSSYVHPAGRPNALGPIDPAIWDHGAPPIGPNSATPNAYLGPVERPNALGPIPAMWDPSALPTGPNWLAGDSPLNLPSAAANLPFQYSHSDVRGPSSPAQPAFARTDYPTWPLPSDSPLFPRRNLLEPAGSMSPWGQPQSGRDGSLVPSPRNVFGPWPGSYLEGPPDFPQSGSCNIFGPWPGSDLPERRNVLYPDLMELLGRYLSR
jgi:hypothetical protein